MQQLRFTHLTSNYDARYASDTLERVLRNPDATLTAINKIKDHGPTTVWEITIDLHRCIIKRYNRKTPAHGIRRFFQRSRAKNCWLQAQALANIGVAVAPPIAWVQKKTLGLKCDSWLISERVDGDDCHTTFENRKQEGSLLMANIVNTLVKLWRAGYSHGDLKATNILIANGNPVLIDLDATQHHRSRFFARRRITRDLRRFLKNWQTEPLIHQQAITALAAYEFKLPEK
jgi:RIO-like serine/threonine protein kinase